VLFRLVDGFSIKKLGELSMESCDGPRVLLRLELFYISALFMWEFPGNPGKFFTLAKFLTQIHWPETALVSVSCATA